RGGPGVGRGSGGEPAQALGGRQGLGAPLSGPWGHARPAGQFAVRRAGSVLLLQPHALTTAPCAGPFFMRTVKGLSILGSTGSVGTNVRRIVEAFPDRLRVIGLAAGTNVERLAAQVAAHRPQVVAVATDAAAEALGRLVDLNGIRVGVGAAGAVAVAT